MPNVLLILTDQQRWDSLGCYGNQVVRTPHLDGMAAEGTVFTRAYSVTPSCVPARASLMTGMDPWHTGILGMGPHDPPCANLTNTLPQTLASAGFHTQGVGKMHFTPQRSLQGFHHTVLDEEARVRDPGFVSDYASWFERNRQADYGRYNHGIDQNSWVALPFHLPEYLHATNWTASEAIRFLERRDPTRPFFLKVSFARPHSPYDPPAEYFDRYAAAELPPPVVGDWVADAGETHDPNARRGRLTSRDARRARAGYYGSVNHIDDQVGRILRYLRDNRLDESTLVVFTSDHGDLLGDHDLWRKTRPYEGATHIPLIVRLPRTAGGPVEQWVGAPVCLQDVIPTVLDIAGVPIPETVDGASLVPLIRGDERTVREFVHGEQSRSPHTDAMQFVVDEVFKYIWFPDRDVEQLFDLGDDPYETRELSGAERYRDDLLRLRRRLVGVLEPRHCGLTEDSGLCSQRGKPPVVSPYSVDRRSR